LQNRLSIGYGQATFQLISHFKRKRRRGVLAGYLRKRIVSFADQVYPTIALVRMAMASTTQEARDMILRTATTMNELQAPPGSGRRRVSRPTGDLDNKNELSPTMPISQVSFTHSMSGPTVGESGSAPVIEALQIRRDMLEVVRNSGSLGMTQAARYCFPDF